MKRSNLRPWTMWACVVLFFAYQFIMRLFPGLVMHDLSTKFAIDATAFGFLSSMYYFGYAGMQIPMALLLDRYSPKFVVAGFAALCSVATLVFVYTDHWFLLLASRFLIGVGSAVGFLGTSKIISQWFPKNRYAQMVGLSFTFGLMGALYGARPTSQLIAALGWERVGLVIGGAGLLIALFIFMVVARPTQQAADQEPENLPVLKSLASIVTKPQLVVMAVANLLMVGSLEGFADVWGVSYLMKTFEFDKSTAASLTSFIFVGMLFGGPLLAMVAQKLEDDYLVTAGAGWLMGLMFFGLILFPHLFSYASIAVLMFLTGILCCYQVLVFSAGSQLVTAQVMGVTVAFLNCINMFGGSFFHMVIGSLLDLVWTGGMENNLRLYTSTEYAQALLAIPVASCVGAAVFLAIRPRKHPVMIRALKPEV